jgi:hypothetical protein
MEAVLRKAGRARGAGGLNRRITRRLIYKKEVLLNWNNWIRQVHRWLSMAFTVAVIGNIIAMAQEKQAIWVGLLALFPLILLMLTGLYMFVLPYAAKWRNG